MGREGEKHQCVFASHVPLTGDLACSPGTCPDWELNLQSFASQAGAQSTEPHQPGLKENLNGGHVSVRVPGTGDKRAKETQGNCP